MPCSPYVRRRTDAGNRVPPNWQWEALDAGSSDGTWWSDGEQYKGIEASIAAVEAAVLDTGAAGIIGHEQGATLAAIVAARAALGEGPALKFVVVCGGTMPTGKYAGVLERQRDDSTVEPICSLHCFDKGMDGAKSAEELAACFAPSAEILWHENGIALPAASWWEQTRAFPERVTGGKQWCTQFKGPFNY